MTAELGKVAVIGAGLIGRAWATAFERAGFSVAIFDADERRRNVATLREALSGAIHAQESIAEELDAKRTIFEEMDALAPPECTLASSSSFIPASRFTSGLHGRARCLIAHPANPPHLIPIVELVPASWTDPEVVARTRRFFERTGQVPIVVRRELDGFILNRLQAALLNEAFRLVEDGYVSAADLDKTISAGLGRRSALMGPFETIDLNAPGGIKDYALRYGPSMLEISRQQADPRPWSDALVARIDAERRELLPLRDHANRQAWRDRRLSDLKTFLSDEEDA